MINILVVDDHPLFRDGFAEMVRKLRPHWTLHFADGATSAIALLSVLALDLVIIDIGLPDADGFGLLRSIAAFSSELPQILISGRQDIAAQIRAQACGARSYIAKTAAPEVIASTIDIVLAGGSGFSIAKKDHPLPILTARQIELLMLLAEGHGNKEIRQRLHIAERTVRAHLTELFLQLGAHSRMQAVVRARELGFIT